MSRLAIRVLVVSVTLSALLGCYAVLAGDWGELQQKVLLSSLTISGASMLAMACGAALEREAWGQAARAGILLALLSATLVLVGVWAEVRGKAFWRSTGSVGLLALALAHACLVALPALPRRHRWVRRATFGASAALTLLILLLIWEVAEDGDALRRLVGVLSVLLGAGTILVPVLGRAARGAGEGDEAGARFCPACGVPLDPTARSATCTACGTWFHVRVRPGRGARDARA